MTTKAFLIKEINDVLNDCDYTKAQKESVEYNTNLLIEYFDKNSLWNKAATYCETLAFYCIYTCVLVSLIFTNERMKNAETFVNFIHDLIDKNHGILVVDDPTSTNENIIIKCFGTIEEILNKKNKNF